MWHFLFRRFMYAILALFVISLISFAVIQLPPGDYVTDMIDRMRLTGAVITPDYEEYLQEVYGFKQPLIVQYVKWVGKIIFRGEFGYSFIYSHSGRALSG